MAGLSEEERRAAFRTARTELRAKIAAVLDPDGYRLEAYCGKPA